MQPLAHFKTITHHRHLVCRYCFRLGLYRQGLLHDLSKYAPCEFWRGAKYYQGYRSPNDAERKQNGVSLAWLHHKGRNRHHFEYWIDYCIGEDGKPYMGGCKMPLRYVAEIFCDRIAACRTYLKDKYTDAAPYDLLYPLEEPYPHPPRDEQRHRGDAARAPRRGRGRRVRLRSRPAAGGKGKKIGKNRFFLVFSLAFSRLQE